MVNPVRWFIVFTTQREGRILLLCAGAIVTIIGSIAKYVIPENIYIEIAGIGKLQVLLAIKVLFNFFVSVFLLLALYLSISVYLNPKRRAHSILAMFQEKTEATVLFYLSEKLGKWLIMIMKYLQKCFDIKRLANVENEDLRNWDTNQFKHLLKKNRFRNYRLLRKITEKKLLLDALFDEIFTSFGISRIVTESILGKVDIGVCYGIAEERDTLYKQIKRAVSNLESGLDPKIKPFFQTDMKNGGLNVKEKLERIEELLRWQRSFKKEKKGKAIEEILFIIKDSSTGRATLKFATLFSSKMREILPQNRENLEDEDLERLKFIVKIANSRIGYPLAELLELKVKDDIIEWNNEPLTKNLRNSLRFFEDFRDKRRDALNSLKSQIAEESRIFIGDVRSPIGVALTYGYSSVLYEIVSVIIQRARSSGMKMEDIKVWLISTEASVGDEGLLSANLRNRFRSLECSIVPIDSVLETNLYKSINRIFVGIESVSRKGLLVHPRGGQKVIYKIKEKNPDLKVYAFGESFKVRDFTEWQIDHLKLFSVDPEYIDYVITDCGIHEKKIDHGKIYWISKYSSQGDLGCCVNHWRKIADLK